MAAPDLRLSARLRRGRVPLLVLAAGLVALVLLAGLPALDAGLVFAAVLLAMALPARMGARVADWREGTVAGPAAAGEPDPVAPGAEAFLQAMPDAALLLDGTLLVRACNAPARELLPGLRLGEPIAYALRVPDVIDAARAVAAGGARRRVDYSERVPVDRLVEAQIARIEPAGRQDDRTWDQGSAVLLVLRDMSQQRRLDEMRADFVANASHELRTPLASLSGFIETLQGPARNDASARERFLAIMQAQAGRMSRLIDDLLSLSRIELNAHVRPDARVDLAAVVAHVADTLSPLARERGVAVGVEGPPALPVRGERDELIRVFENLVENAIKYGASGGRVEVQLAVEPRRPAGAPEAVVTVRDFGPGIAAEHLPRLTERFYRVDVASSREKGGTGLGLAIVKHILARHRGRLAVQSRVGEGAAFTVRMPAEPGTPTQDRAQPTDKADVLLS